MFGSKLSWASALVLAGAGIVNACVQVSLTSIKNTNGVITDYQTPEDEIYIWFGVSEYMIFTYRNNFKRDQEHMLADGDISIPCFHEAVFYIDMTEMDDFVNEKSQIMLACKNFQLGHNEIVMELTENNAAINSVADVINSVAGTEFDFGGNSNQKDKTAEYTFNFQVTQTCYLDNKAKVDFWGSNSLGDVRFFGQSIDDVIMPLIEQENANIKAQEKIGQDLEEASAEDNTSDASKTEAS